MDDRSVQISGGVSQSVIITGDGNTVSLVFGTAGLALSLRRPQISRPARRKPAPASEPFPERTILVPDSGKLPFIGRDDLLSELRDWLTAETDVSVHALTAPAGTGKTRLGIRLCAELDADYAAKGDWVAGFLSADDLPAIADASATHRFNWERNTLLVIDYAARRYEALGRWLDKLADTRLERTKIRILLLERQAPEGFGWWRDLTSPASQSEQRRADLFHAARPRDLPDLADLEERRRLMAVALDAARKLRADTLSASTIPAKGENPPFDARLSDPQFGNPLAVVMAGIIALERGAETGLALRRLSAARYFGRRELQRFADMATGLGGDGDAMRHLVVFNGLAGGLPLAGLQQAVVAELTAAGRSAKLDPLCDLLEQELPPRSEDATTAEPHLGAIQPDLIGEAAIVEHFSGRLARESEAPQVGRRAYAVGQGRAAQALFRLVQDFGFAAEDPDATREEQETGQQVLGWVQTLAKEITDPAELVPLVTALPEQTLILREEAAELTHRLTGLFAARTKSDSSPTLLEAAAWSFNALANRESHLDRREAALAAAEEAVRLYRCCLAANRSEVSSSGLAMSLNNLSNKLWALCRQKESIAAGEEAVQRARELAKTQPDAFTRILAAALTNLVGKLGTVGRREDALTNANEAFWLYQGLVNERASPLPREMAVSLTNLAIALRDLGQLEAALEPATEAVRQYRRLAQSQPDSFLPHLATSLNNLGVILGNLNRLTEALSKLDEAVKLRRSLARKRPDAFDYDLAVSLRNLAGILASLDGPEAALAPAEEAVQLNQKLVEKRPENFAEELTRSLRQLGDLYAKIGDRPREILALHREIVALTPAFQRHPLALEPIMDGLCRFYILACDAAGRNPEEAILVPIAAYKSADSRENTHEPR